MQIFPLFEIRVHTFFVVSFGNSDQIDQNIIIKQICVRMSVKSLYCLILHYTLKLKYIRGTHSIEKCPTGRSLLVKKSFEGRNLQEKLSK
jgi:hypothetical protein